MKKNLLKYITVCLAGGMLLQSCDKNFEALNTNPNASPNPTPAYVFTKAQLDGAGDVLNLLHGTMQYTTSYNDVAGFGAKYVLAQSQQSWTVFNNAYPKEINEITQVINAVKANPDQINLLSAARVWRAYCFSRVTDLYGDIPYSDAAKGYTEAIYKPKYDEQKAIYADMLKELDEAASAFNASNTTTFGAADLMYAGNVTKWKKFAYSLMLRLAMRMTKVDIAAAETWAKKAIAGGVIIDDADMARVNGYVLAGQDINKNPLAFNWFNSDYSKADGVSNTEGGKYQDVFINYLKDNKDPRLAVLSVVWVNKLADTTSATQKGMSAKLGTKPTDFGTYSEPNPATILQLNSPYLLLTNAETNFLLAEAALRGWYSAATASTLYENGISAAMRQWALFGSGNAGVISSNQIQTYIKYHKLNTAGSFAQQMEQIYTQFWVGVFPNATEVFASYRRTGYPALVPNTYVGNATGGKIFRRFLYPATEQNLNGENYNAVIARQGPDEFLTRMWWDRP
ncbi:SusD/RagB family nutrient-binding outer membrane lipoprotein [Mucilaginibacter pallidiroseus]|uniref:SusD/RagB family nutrient-binding outer membrane lipoprotein n=1 Tax=Mucilaginibacter pallidiroseus TaxID=2599295 RepID=A0A563UCV6_9SPHI|nr:SusD/RagB family nutrient-binding outer membrane lipoprotein [Mucilaginibacter pallidiroseus]TWR29188.1 SusD/RagB family nutrient-binding outer membrane lipoprotein [Mucilaginibacter pallidiroseus]